MCRQARQVLAVWVDFRVYGVGNSLEGLGEKCRKEHFRERCLAVHAGYVGEARISRSGDQLGSGCGDQCDQQDDGATSLLS